MGFMSRAAMRRSVVFPAPFGSEERDEFAGADFEGDAAECG